MSRAYLSGNCLLGAIFGTGTNGCYVESVDEIRKFSPEIRKELAGSDAKSMIINGEWGAFDNAVSYVVTVGCQFADYGFSDACFQ